MARQSRPDTIRPMSRDEVLVWLNQRLGSHVHVEVSLERGGYAFSVLGSQGLLRSWRDDRPEWTNIPGEDLVGAYTVDRSAHFDLSDLDRFEACERLDLGRIEIELAENVHVFIEERSA